MARYPKGGFHAKAHAALTTGDHAGALDWLRQWFGHAYLLFDQARVIAGELARHDPVGVAAAYRAGAARHGVKLVIEGASVLQRVAPELALALIDDVFADPSVGSAELRRALQVDYFASRALEADTARLLTFDPDRLEPGDVVILAGTLAQHDPRESRVWADHAADQAWDSDAGVVHRAGLCIGRHDPARRCELWLRAWELDAEDGLDDDPEVRAALDELHVELAGVVDLCDDARALGELVLESRPERSFVVDGGDPRALLARADGPRVTMFSDNVMRTIEDPDNTDEAWNHLIDALRSLEELPGLTDAYRRDDDGE